ncbi:MAG: hypothetical protein JWN44_1319 [Myxococcales bacterium]|nr:hypothetical protein [Myxococcales bacterium]
MRRPQWLPTRVDAPGLTLALVVGAAAWGGAKLLPPTPFLSDILLALIAGALILNTPLRGPLKLALPGPDREPDRYAHGLRFVGKWVLRLGIVLMGLKVQTELVHAADLALIAGVILCSLPSAFFIAHSVSAMVGLRRPMADLVAGGTMICGASAVNAIAPVANAHREEQGVAIGTVFAFSVVALFVFRPVAQWVGLDPAHAGLWSGLAVNDLSSAIAVGQQMGAVGGVMAAASKSARVLCLAPVLFLLAFARRTGDREALKKSAVEQVPRYLLGYVALALVRALGDRFLGGAAWSGLLAVDKSLVDLLLVTVAAAIGLHLPLASLLGPGARALVAGGATSLWMAGLTLSMVTAASRGARSAAALVGLCALAASFAAFRWFAAAERALAAIRRRYASGAPLSLGEATKLLDAMEAEAPVDDATRRQLLRQLHPSIGELIYARESPNPHGEGCRWVTYWQGASGWALVALCRQPGSSTPIHAHPHRMIGKSIEGALEELRFLAHGDAVELVEKRLIAHNELVETDGLATIHAVRVVGPSSAIDLQLRGPESGAPGRRLRTLAPLDLTALSIGARLAVVDEADDRPGHGGEGAGAATILR